MRRFNFLNLLEVGLILFVTLMPLQNRDLFSLWGTRLFPSRSVLIVLIAASGGYVIYSLWQRKTDLLAAVFGFVRKDRFFQLLLFLWLVRLVSLRSSLNLRASLSLFLFYTSMISLYVLLHFLSRHRSSFLPKLFKVHLLTLSLVGLYGLVQVFLAVVGLRLPGVLTGGTFVRVPATFYDANHLPAYLITGLPSILILAFYTRNEIFRNGLYALTALLSFLVFLSYSRSGIIGFSLSFFGLLAYFLLKRYWRKLAFLAVGLVLVSTFILITSRTNYSLVRRLGSVFNVEDKSTVAHGLLLYGGLKVWQDSPIFGVGYGSFSEAFRASEFGKQHAYFDPAVSIRLPVHSIWLETLAETGIIGFVVYLSLMLLILEVALKALKLADNKAGRLRRLAILVSFLSLVTAGLFYSYNLEFFWFFLFFAYLISQKERWDFGPETAGTDDERINWVEVAVPFFLFLFFVGVIGYRLDRVTLAEGTESVFALVAKTMRRAFGYEWPNFFLPRLQSPERYLMSYPPLFFFLNAFSFFLYDLGNFSVRVWSAFFGSFSLLFFYLIGRRVGQGRRAGLILSWLILSLPNFLPSARSPNSTITVFFFLSLSVLAFLYFDHFFLSRVVFFLSVLFLPLFRHDFLLLSLPFLAILPWWLPEMISRFRKSYYRLVALACLLSLSATVFWLVLASRWLGRSPWVDFLRTGWALIWGDLVIFATVMLVILAIARTRWEIFSYRLLLLISLATLFLRLIDANIDQNRSYDRVRLIADRLQLDRDGRIKLFLQGGISETDEYYSEVNLGSYVGIDIFENFIADQDSYVVIDGGQLNRLRLEKIQFSPMLTISSASGNLVLVHKSGQKPL